MPLLILAGIPCAGKTQRAKQLQMYFDERIAQTSATRKVHWLSDESLGIAKSAYDAAREEKKARGQLLSAVERALSRDDIVIADGLNYIKGFRYQLYCVARAIGTPHCVVHVATPPATARAWNCEAKPQSERYELAMFDNLVSRFEEPDGRNRWDAPLFTVLSTDAAPPLDAIWDALIHRKAAPPNLSTAVKPVTDTNYVHEIDQITQSIVQAVLLASGDGGSAQGVVVPHTAVTVDLPPRTVSLAELRRIRRQFININRMHLLLGADRIAELFVEYLNTNLC
ncbi:kti12, chromatin associated [Dimargaris verticillata]|uniref:Kti12, chromatin associated n=1 Tax=Dimargaris verticillata TaxID=2761393 RepID=A0A9W8B4W0_9FUNG|nr:kti12, chromatin associated [Dimargaris verticillata]